MRRGVLLARHAYNASYFRPLCPLVRALLVQLQALVLDPTRPATLTRHTRLTTDG
jgi:hypothetical protein